MRKYIFLMAVVLLAACTAEKADHLTILSTSDTHSQVEPLPANVSRDADMGGYARRMGMIERERQTDPDLLLFDSGDFSQGTPYFNFYHGRIEMEALNRMGYDAATIGNHEFDNGIDTLAMVLKLANFPIVVANYDVAGTPLEGIVKPYAVLTRRGLRIGVFGLGVAPDDLISAKNFAGIRYLDPLPVINETAALLRNEKHCDVVICLSHLGSDVPGVKGHEADYDLNLIPMTHGVDVFLSGHTHHVLEERVPDADGHEVILTQTGKAAVRVGKMILHLVPAED
ncbi:MAG: metallophosphatase [Bacteroidales bacterium]|nr:metallophosphatase [Candidatus Colicola faecequi]